MFQRLKESASKLTVEQMTAVVKYHVEQTKVIEMQREAADIIRRSVDSEYHEHFDTITAVRRCERTSQGPLDVSCSLSHCQFLRVFTSAFVPLRIQADLRAIGFHQYLTKLVKSRAWRAAPAEPSFPPILYLSIV
jgi:hypothetical protein